MANTNSAKGNPASKRMSNPNNKNKRIRNKAKNEQLRAKNEHPKQLRAAANHNRHVDNIELALYLGIDPRGKNLSKRVKNAEKMNQKLSEFAGANGPQNDERNQPRPRRDFRPTSSERG